MNRHLPLLTESRLRAYRRCAREEKLRYQDGLLTGKSAALAFGTLIHACLELWWKMNLAAVEDWLASQTGVDQYEIAKAWALMRAYDVRYREDKQRYEVIAVEAEFRAPLRNPITGAESRTWELAGKIDVIVRDRVTGDVFIIEHKTSSEDISPGAGYWVRLRMDGQISCYFVGAGALGYQATGCLYDVIGKPEQRPSQIPLVDTDGVKIVVNAAGERVRTKDGKKWRESGDSAQGFVQQTRQETPEEYGERIFAAIGEDPDRYFARATIVRLEQELHDWQLDTWQLAGQMRDARRLGIATRNPDACVRFGSSCGYLPLCSGESNPESFQRVEWVHPELSPQFAATTKEESQHANAPSSTTEEAA